MPYRDRATSTTSGLVGGTCADGAQKRVVDHSYDGLGRTPIAETDRSEIAVVAVGRLDLPECVGENCSAVARLVRRTTQLVLVDRNDDVGLRDGQPSTPPFGGTISTSYRPP